MRRRRYGFVLTESNPATLMRPEVGWIRPATVRSSAVFPRTVRTSEDYALTRANAEANLNQSLAWSESFG